MYRELADGFTIVWRRPRELKKAVDKYFLSTRYIAIRKRNGKGPMNLRPMERGLSKVKQSAVGLLSWDLQETIFLVRIQRAVCFGF